MWALDGKKNMLTLKARTIEAKSHLQTKIVFWLLFVGSRGRINRIRIMSVLRKKTKKQKPVSNRTRHGLQKTFYTT